MRMGALALAIVCPALLIACSGEVASRDEANGEMAGMRGDWAAATPMFEKAYAEHPDVVSEFNLATAYENTGQNDKAIALFEVVVIDGYYTESRLLTPAGGVAEPNAAIYLSDEATNRMAVMASRKALLAHMAVMTGTKVLPVEKVLICDFPDRNGNGTSRLGQIIVYVDDKSRTASTLGFFVSAPKQQEVDRFNANEIAWTQRYQIVGRTNVYHYRLNRQTGSLDVTRPTPDPSREGKVTASCHARIGA
jgi:hypothetical protein